MFTDLSKLFSFPQALPLYHSALLKVDPGFVHNLSDRYGFVPLVTMFLLLCLFLCPDGSLICFPCSCSILPMIFPLLNSGMSVSL